MATETTKSKNADAEVDLKGATSVVSMINRAMARFSEIPVLKASELGVADWALLQIINANPTTRAGQMARRLEVSPQRVNTLVKSLRAAGYVDVITSKDDTRARDIAITDTGRARVKEIDREMLAIFMNAFKDKPTALRSLRGSLKRLVEAMPVTEDGPKPIPTKKKAT